MGLQTGNPVGIFVATDTHYCLFLICVCDCAGGHMSSAATFECSVTVAAERG